MAKITGGELVVRCLEKENVKYIFGIPGDQLYPILDAIYQREKEGKMKFILTRHEAAAAHAADAYARITGKPGVCLATVGPGAANIIAGVYAAYADNVPLIVLTAQNQSWRIYPDHGSMQGLNQRDLFKPVTKWNVVVSHWERIPHLIQWAFRAATSGKPGPVHIDLPSDILFKTDDENKVKVLEPSQYRAVEPPAGNPQLINAAAKMLVEAQFPIIHAGSGVLRAGASQKLVELAEYLQIPVTTTIGARGIIPEDHPLCLIPASFGAMAAQAEADVVLFIGGKMGDLDFWGRPPGWGEPETQKFIQIDVDGTMIALNRQVDLAIIADAKVALTQLLEEVKKLTARRSEPNPKLAECKEAQEMWLNQFREMAESNQSPIHPLRAIKEIREHYPRNAISVIDGGNTAVWAFYLNRIYEPHTFIWAADSGHLGSGIAYTIGAKIAQPERQVYCITGDGSLMFNIQELETLARNKLPVTIIVLNDRSYGMIKTGQKLTYEERYIGVDFIDVRYDKIAEAMNCYGERVTEPNKIKEALKNAEDSGKPALIDIITLGPDEAIPPDFETLAALWLEGCEGIA